jgi:cytidyltransferase-like protein
MAKVMIFGTFDHFHDGHRFLVNKAREKGSVVVLVAADPTVRMIKGRSPLQPLDVRMKTLASEFPDVRVIPGTTGDFLRPLRVENPDLLLFGYDQRLPPGISEKDLEWRWERAEAFQPEIFKSSLLSRKKGESD